MRKFREHEGLFDFFEDIAALAVLIMRSTAVSGTTSRFPLKLFNSV